MVVITRVYSAAVIIELG